MQDQIKRRVWSGSTLFTHRNLNLKKKKKKKKETNKKTHEIYEDG